MQSVLRFLRYISGSSIFDKGRITWYYILLGFVLQIIFWNIAYYIWRYHTHMRFFSTPRLENLTFWVVFCAVYINQTLIFPIAYRYKKFVWYLVASAFLVVITSIVEHSMVISVLFLYMDPEWLKTEAFLLETQVETGMAILIRNVVIFSGFTMFYVYKNALQAHKLQTEQINFHKLIQRLRAEGSHAMGHQHFALNALQSIVNRLPEEDQQSRALGMKLLEIQRYSFNKMGDNLCRIEEELNFARSLTEYFQIVYPEVPTHFSIKGSVPPFSIPPLISEVLICNMFQHGRCDALGYMDICFDFSTEDTFELTCSNIIGDTQLTFTDPQSRGLRILSERLELSYGSYANVNCSLDGLRFLSTIRITL